MIRRPFLLHVLLSLGGVLAALAPSLDLNSQVSPARAGRLRLLILSGKNNHAWQDTAPALRAIYEASGRFTVDVTQDPASCDAARLAGYDAIVSNWRNFPSPGREWGPAAERGG